MLNYRSALWRALRIEALVRAGSKCSVPACLAITGLEVDHIEPVSEAPEKAFDLSNLRVYCSRCHAIRHGHDPDELPDWWKRRKETVAANEDQMELPLKEAV